MASSSLHAHLPYPAAGLSNLEKVQHHSPCYEGEVHLRKLAEYRLAKIPLLK